MRPVILAAVFGYLLGSIPFGYILVRAFRGSDIRQTGSGNIGATNVARTSPALGITTLLLDAAKGAAAVFLAVLLNPAHPKDFVPCGSWADFSCTHSKDLALAVYLIPTVAALFAIAGHMFPVWLRFRGGKGVATTVGAFAALVPHAILACLGIFLVIVGFTRYVSLGSISAAVLLPVFVWVMNRESTPDVVLALISIASLLVIVRHHQNISRLFAGTEHRFSLRRG
jgi:acyl phosphate:glycerol-3-phosphate acyltransferase